MDRTPRLFTMGGSPIDLERLPSREGFGDFFNFDLGGLLGKEDGDKSCQPLWARGPFGLRVEPLNFDGQLLSKVEREFP